MSLIELSGIHKIFGRRPHRGLERLAAGETREDLLADGLTAAVIDASINVEPGEIFVVMGLSGSGKSTLIRLVNRLIEPTSGSVVIDGVDLSGLGSSKLRAIRREKISMVFQHFALLPHRTVGENAAYGLKVRGINKSDRFDRAEEALQLVGLGGWGGVLPGDLSGGMRQRVGLARALAAQTDIMLMDEAFSALDPLIRREMQDQLIDLQDKLDKTILFITHDLNEAMRLGDRIAMMRDGRVVQQGTAEQILNDPANDYVAQFVQDVDRTRVLNAASVMEAPVALLGADQGPRAAHKLIRENQLSGLMVVDRSRRLLGAVTESAIAEAVARGHDTVEGHMIQPHVVTPDTLIAEMFTASAESPVPLAVVNAEGRLEGVIARVTLLSALGTTGQLSGSDGDGGNRDGSPAETGHDVEEARA
ncbi:betaine/proline/choline family ABC transporter ATP-binding protein [Nocardioides sp. AE5]|uniref:quaternary amine ABC transporter ATP-binding protein n=1 Tax=Nocardioides sp. AE5 TaxID=2962573 RepID=UPI002881A3AE|nr:betaine/proline/choline family ABC transporter ATP-binding protein [Nocardioides sp. AE5]MDT0202337.1 betaine/proline/choline family ABC transporter ATP-binding protein [Nocardioides sp. AE5]